MTAPAYLIRKSGVWYRPNSAGYTNNIAEAGRYTLAEAVAITHPNGPDGPRDNMSYEPDPALPPIKAGEAVPVAMTQSSTDSLVAFPAEVADLGAKLSRFGLDATDVDMLRRGDMLGGKAGAKFFDAVSTLERELDAVTRDRDAGRTVYLTFQQSAAVLASRLTAAEAKAARMGEALKDVHRVLCDTRIAPSHLVGADIEWCIDHCRIGMKEPTP